MAVLNLSREVYRDKVYGGWLGKNVGGTLGAPLEGKKETHNLAFYDPIPGQPAANDDLDIQLVWLHVLRSRGIDVTTDDLTAAWLEHIAYAWDEYGYAAYNLRRGLRPPLSGAFNNWFKHSMSGPIRSELWAMVAPGAPQVAAALAYQDGTIDHAEDGVWGQMFWSAIQSAAFFLTDTQALLDVGLAMIPATCRTARAVRAARDAAYNAKTLSAARDLILHEVGHENFTDAPQNIGFTVLGWLYGGGDFGASLCSTVNCGYDTDATCATLGALLGILKGRSGLPANWLEPLGDAVVMGWGIRGLDVEHTVAELTEHTVEVGERMLAARCPDVALVDADGAPMPSEPSAAAPAEGGLAGRARLLEFDTPPATEPAPAAQEAPAAAPAAEPAPGSASGEVVEASAPVEAAPAEAASTDAGTTLPADAEPAAPAAPAEPPAPSVNWRDNSQVKPLLVTSSNTAFFEAGPFAITVDYGQSGPVVLHAQALSLMVTVRNTSDTDFVGRLRMLTPPEWQVAVPGAQGERQMLARGGMARFGFVLRASEKAPLSARNLVTLALAPEDGSQPFTCDIPLLGGTCWWVVGPFDNMSDEGFDRNFAPEDRPALDQTYVGRSGAIVRWQRRTYAESVMDLEEIFGGVSGVLYLRTSIRARAAIPAKLTPHTNDGLVLWLNRKRLLRLHSHDGFRPQLNSGPLATDITLQPGENELTIKVVRCRQPAQFALNLTAPNGEPLLDIDWTHWQDR